MVEQRPFKAWVDGSSPSSLTKIFKSGSGANGVTVSQRSLNKNKDKATQFQFKSTRGGYTASVLPVLVDYVIISAYRNLHGERRGTWKKEK